MIVESPAKAKTIERYLGPGYTVLASYGHVRDLPENPGKDKLGVDVEHDFAPTYEISPDRHRQVAAIEKAARTRGPRLPRHRPRPRGRGDRLARRGGDRAARGSPVAGDVQRDHRAGDPRGVRPSARDRPGPRGRPAGPPDRGPAGRLHPQPAALAQGPLGPVGRPGPVGRGPPRGRSRARDPGVHARRVLDDRGAPHRARRQRLPRRARADRRREARDRRRRRRPSATSRRSGPASPSSTRSRSSARSAARRRRSRPRRSSRRPAASSASARSGRCRSPSDSTRESRRPMARSA